MTGSIPPSQQLRRLQTPSTANASSSKNPFRHVSNVWNFLTNHESLSIPLLILLVVILTYQVLHLIIFPCETCAGAMCDDSDPCHEFASDCTKIQDQIQIRGCFLSSSHRICSSTNKDNCCPHKFTNNRATEYGSTNESITFFQIHTHYDEISSPIKTTDDPAKVRVCYAKAEDTNPGKRLLLLVPEKNRNYLNLSMQKCEFKLVSRSDRLHKLQYTRSGVIECDNIYYMKIHVLPPPAQEDRQTEYTYNRYILLCQGTRSGETVDFIVRTHTLQNAAGVWELFVGRQSDNGRRFWDSVKIRYSDTSAYNQISTLVETTSGPASAENIGWKRECTDAPDDTICIKKETYNSGAHEIHWVEFRGDTTEVPKKYIFDGHKFSKIVSTVNKDNILKLYNYDNRSTRRTIDWQGKGFCMEYSHKHLLNLRSGGANSSGMILPNNNGISLCETFSNSLTSEEVCLYLETVDREPYQNWNSRWNTSIKSSLLLLRFAAYTAANLSADTIQYYDDDPSFISGGSGPGGTETGGVCVCRTGTTTERAYWVNNNNHSSVADARNEGVVCKDGTLLDSPWNENQRYSHTKVECVNP